jgi:hypothetical protein
MVPKPGRKMLRKSDKRPAWWFESLKSFIVMHIFINEYYRIHTCVSKGSVETIFPIITPFYKK